MSEFGESLVGTTIAERFRVDKMIGKGGLGIVFSGLHLSLNKPVAIKVLNAQNGVSQEHQKRFEQEARITSQLDHQNIVTVYDFGQLSNGSSYIVMDLVKGENLESLISNTGVILGDYKRIFSILLQVCAGLSHAHQAGVIHRDLTPANIMLTKNMAGEEIVKILDFGLSRNYGPATENEQRLTSEGHVVGTCLYMSPEQCSDFNLDGRSDIYTLVCVMYEVLTGKLPLVGQSALQTLQMQISQDPQPFANVTNMNVPAGLEEIVFKAMRKNRTERYQTVDALAEDIKRVRDGLGISAGAPKSGASDAKPKVNTSTIRMSPITLEEVSVGASSEYGDDAAQKRSASAESQTPGKKPPKMVLAVAAVAVLVIAAFSFPMLQSKTNTGTSQPDNKVAAVDTAKAAVPDNSKAATGEKAAPAVEEKPGKWSTLQKEGDKLREDGKFADAEEKYSKSLAELEATGRNSKSLVDALKRMSDIAYIQGEIKEAQKFDKRAADVSKNIEPAAKAPGPEDEHKAVIDRLASLAQLCHNDGQCDRAEILLKRSIEIAKKVYGPDSKQVNQRLDDLATFYLSMGEDQKANEILKTISGKNKQ